LNITDLDDVQIFNKCFIYCPAEDKAEHRKDDNKDTQNTNKQVEGTPALHL